MPDHRERDAALLKAWKKQECQLQKSRLSFLKHPKSDMTGVWMHIKAFFVASKDCPQLSSNCNPTATQLPSTQVLDDLEEATAVLQRAAALVPQVGLREEGDRS